jgi:hypothetical protein
LKNHWKALCLAAGAASIGGHAHAAIYFVEFEVDFRTAFQTKGMGLPYDLAALPIVSGSLTADSAFSDARGVIALNYNVGTRAFTAADIDPTPGYGELIEQQIHGGNRWPLRVGINFLSGESLWTDNSATLFDANNGIACNSCVRITTMTVDGVRVSPAPEPSTWGLILVGFTGVGSTIRLGRRPLTGPGR